MEKKMKLTFCKGDFLAIALVAVMAILVSIVFWTNVGAEEGSIVKIYQDGKIIKELPLDVETEFVVAGDYINKIVVKDGKASIAESDCPGNDCVHSGAIFEAGRSIVCLPNRVELRIEGASAVDFVVR